MKYGIEKYSKTLELDKILELLANETALEDAADLAKQTIPETDIKKVAEILEQTKTAHAFLSRYSSPHFSSAVNVLSTTKAKSLLIVGNFEISLNFIFPTFLANNLSKLISKT